VPHSVSSQCDTVDRVLVALAKRTMMVFARIDHAAGVANAGLALRPTEVMTSGNAKGGTAPMQDSQSAGIDLPLKAPGAIAAEVTT